ncbi:hypothetical protein BJY52DRAFT_1226406 [Lactarius psammicola]|nr:hypothetical protein BJY52DRAFT_1226406 [Lactarius psammicola]
MVIHRRTPRNIPTTPSLVSGYLWGIWPRRATTHSFHAVLPLHGDVFGPPYVDIETAFFSPGVSPPNVYDTLIRVGGHKLLITGYFDNRCVRNPNLQRDFPLIPWQGEIAVLFIGKRRAYVSRAPPRPLVHFAIARYMEVCIAHAEVGSPFPAYITFGLATVQADEVTTMGHWALTSIMSQNRFHFRRMASNTASRLDQGGWTIKTLDRVLHKWVSMIPEFLSSQACMDPSGSSDDECASVQLGSSDMAPSATKTILRQRFPMRRYHVGSDGRLSNLPKVMEAPNSYTTDVITQSVAAFLQPHTSSPSVSVVSRVMASLMGGDFGSEELDQVLSTQLDALAISPQAKQNIIPALLGIAKLAEVRSQCASASTSFSQPMVSEPEPELMDSNAEASYQIRQRPFSSNSGSGYTTWYLGRSSFSVLMPPTVPQAKTGHLYVHRDTSRNAFLYWILTTANRWEHVSSGAEHPLNHDRVLAIRANGEPSWVTRASTVTTKTRKEKEIRENLSRFAPLVTAETRTGSLARSHPAQLRSLLVQSHSPRLADSSFPFAGSQQVPTRWLLYLIPQLLKWQEQSLRFLDTQWLLYLVSQVLKSQEPPVLYEVSSAPLAPRLPHALPAPAAWPCIYFDSALTLVTQSDLVSAPLNGSATTTTRTRKVRNKAEDLGSSQHGIPNAGDASAQ